MTPLLVLRPQPGAEATAWRAREYGLDPVVAPLFAIAPLAWQAPDPARYDAVMMTSANAARHAGPRLAAFRHLPLYAVGAATAIVANAAGFGRVVAGAADAAALLATIADTRARLLHLCGAHHKQLPDTGPFVDAIPVYQSVAAEALPPAARIARAVVLLHSARAAAVYAALLDDARLPRTDLSLVAIGADAAAAAGTGWRHVAAAAEPRGDAMLAIARSLCENRAR